MLNIKFNLILLIANNKIRIVKKNQNTDLCIEYTLFSGLLTKIDPYELNAGTIYDLNYGLTYIEYVFKNSK